MTDIAAAIEAFGGPDRARKEINYWLADDTPQIVRTLALAALESHTAQDANLRALRDWVVTTAWVDEKSRGYDVGKITPLNVIDKIDRLLSASPMTAAVTPEHWPEPAAKEPDEGDEVLRNYCKSKRGMRNPCLYEEALLELCHRALAKGAK